MRSTRYARVQPFYRTRLARKRPTYSISTVEDADGIEGSFKINNLMAITPKTPPVSVLNAVIDLDFVRTPVARDISDDIIEID